MKNFILAHYDAVLKMAGTIPLQPEFTLDSCPQLYSAHLQMFPLVWTHQSNPTIRIPYFAMFPFALVLAGLAIATPVSWFGRYVVCLYQKLGTD